MNVLRDAALHHVGYQRPVFPCHPQTKRPLVTHGFKEATCDREIISRWWARWPQAMIGMPTGPASGVWVLDVDDRDQFEAHCSLAVC